jgi:hypothetical protein
MTDKTNADRQPNWKPDQMETDEPGRSEERRPEELKGGLRGGGGPEWNKGQMEFDHQKTVRPSDMKESEEGPWGTAEQAERARREEKDEH